MSIQGLICFTPRLIEGCSESNRPIIVVYDRYKGHMGRTTVV